MTFAHSVVPPWFKWSIWNGVSKTVSNPQASEASSQSGPLLKLNANKPQTHPSHCLQKSHSLSSFSCFWYYNKKQSCKLSQYKCEFILLLLFKLSINEPYPLLTQLTTFSPLNNFYLLVVRWRPLLIARPTLQVSVRSQVAKLSDRVGIVSAWTPRGLEWPSLARSPGTYCPTLY